MRCNDIEMLALMIYGPNFVVIGVESFLLIFYKCIVCPRAFPEPETQLILMHIICDYGVRTCKAREDTHR